MNSIICQKLLPKITNYHVFGRQEFDVENLNHIKSFDFSEYDTVINFAGHAKGNYLSPIENSNSNYISQIDVNFTSHILIVKKFISQNPYGRYIWFSSILSKNCRPYQSVYGASKKATEYVFENWQKEYKNFSFINFRLGRTKTNHLYNTFEGTKTSQEVNDEYNLSPYLDAQTVASKIKLALESSSHTEEIIP